jgi:hypothetical protein
VRLRIREEMRTFAALVVTLVAGGFVVAGCRPGGDSGGPAPVAESSNARVSPTPQERAIAAVLASAHRRKFGSFPHRVGRQRCVIRGGGPAPGLRIMGLCSTRVIYDSGGSGAEVVFTQTWPWRSFHTGTARRPQKHSWRFIASGNGDVSPHGESGDFPPQYAR